MVLDVGKTDVWASKQRIGRMFSYLERSVSVKRGVMKWFSEIVVEVDNIAFSSLIRVSTVVYSLFFKAKSLGFMLLILFASSESFMISLIQFSKSFRFK